MSESIGCICRYCSIWSRIKMTFFFFLFFFRWIRYNIHASVTCVIRAPGMVALPAWAPLVCLPAGCTQGVTSSSQRRQQPTLPSTSTPTYTAISPCTTSPTCPDHCCPPSTPPLRSHTARLDARTCTGNSQLVGTQCLCYFFPATRGVTCIKNHNLKEAQVQNFTSYWACPFPHRWLLLIKQWRNATIHFSVTFFIS